MKYVIRIALLALIAVLTYLTYESIAEPVRYEKEVKIKEAAVVAKLKVLRKGEIAFKDEFGDFSKNFDTLLNFMEYGKMKVLIMNGNADDSTSVFTSTETFVSVKDSLFKNVDIANLRYIPFYDKVEFLIDAGQIKKNNVMVDVFQIKDPKPFSKERRRTGEPLQVGTMFDVNYNGNWK